MNDKLQNKSSLSKLGYKGLDTHFKWNVDTFSFISTDSTNNLVFEVSDKNSLDIIG